MAVLEHGGLHHFCPGTSSLLCARFGFYEAVRTVYDALSTHAELYSLARLVTNIGISGLRRV